jgi:hypothetical protein
MSDDKADKKVQNKPIEKEDAKPQTDQLTPSNVKWQAGDPAEAKQQNGVWRVGRYKAYFPQYNYHSVGFSDGTSATVGEDEIRVPKEAD